MNMNQLKEWTSKALLKGLQVEMSPRKSLGMPHQTQALATYLRQFA
jgi:hypothetical protein